MEQHFHITDISTPKAKAFLEFIKTLDFISVDDDKHNLVPTMSTQEIIDQAEKAEKDIKEGKTTSHDDFQKEFKKW